MKKQKPHPLLEKFVKKIELKFFVISDIHLSFKKLEKLKRWYFDINTESYDYLLISGDFA